MTSIEYNTLIKRAYDSLITKSETHNRYMDKRLKIDHPPTEISNNDKCVMKNISIDHATYTLIQELTKGIFDPVKRKNLEITIIADPQSFLI